MPETTRGWTFCEEEQGKQRNRPTNQQNMHGAFTSLGHASLPDTVFKYCSAPRSIKLDGSLSMAFRSAALPRVGKLSRPRCVLNDTSLPRGCAENVSCYVITPLCYSLPYNHQVAIAHRHS